MLQFNLYLIFGKNYSLAQKDTERVARASFPSIIYNNIIPNMHK